MSCYFWIALYIIAALAFGNFSWYAFEPQVVRGVANRLDADRAIWTGDALRPLKPRSWLFYLFYPDFPFLVRRAHVLRGNWAYIILKDGDGKDVHPPGTPLAARIDSRDLYVALHFVLLPFKVAELIIWYCLWLAWFLFPVIVRLPVWTWRLVNLPFRPLHRAEDAARAKRTNS